MTASSCLALALFASALLAPPVAASPGAPSAPPAAWADESTDEDEHTLLVRFRPGLESAGLRRLRSLGAEGPAEVPGTDFWLVGAGDRDAGDVEPEWRRVPEVAELEPNYVRQAAATPSDPYYSAQASYLETIRLPQAWDLTTGGDDLVLGVVDSGVDLDHPDLAGRLLPGRDIVNGDDSPDDDYGHGTQVATIAAAGANDGKGMAGVAGRAKILPVKVLDADGDGRDSNIATGITWAADHGADVINLSVYGRSSGQTVKAAIEYAQSRDVLVVAAAGNDRNSSPLYPAAYDGVVAVSAVDGDGELASFSNYGSWVHLAAPGVGLLAGANDGGYRVVEGTSFAAPIVSGVALLARARYPDDDAAGIRQRLRTGARDVGVLGRDDVFGYGIVDALGALGGPRASRPPAHQGHEPDGSPDRATALREGSAATSRLAPADDVDWFYTDVTSPAFVTFTISPPPGDGPRQPLHEATVYAPDMRAMDRMTAFTSEATTTVHVPAGRVYLRVQNGSLFAPTGDYQVTVSSTLAPIGYFGTTHLGGAYSESPATAVAIGDLTGDGAPDVIASAKRELLLFTQETEHFERFKRHATIGEASGVAVGDLDGDGDLDAVAATSAGAEVFHQVGGELRGPELMGAEGSEQIEIADLDGDGRLDVVLAGAGVRVLRGGDFEAVAVTSVSVAEIEVADMDNDGRHDIVALECAAACQDVVVYTNPLGPGLDRIVGHVDDMNGLPGSGCALGVGDVNGDGHRDAIASCPDGPGVRVLPRQPDGTFGPITHYLSAALPRALEGGDLNGDGRDDLVVSFGYEYDDDTEGGTKVLWQQADGTLGFERELRDDSDGRFVTAKGMSLGDVDGDGLLDLATARPGWVAVDRLVPEGFHYGEQLWVRDIAPAPGSSEVASDVAPTMRFMRMIDPDSLQRASAKLADASNGGAIPVDLRYDSLKNSVVVQPRAALAPNHAYLFRLAGLRDAAGATMPAESLRFAVASEPSPSLPPPPGPPAASPVDELPHQVAQSPPPARSGYWMVGSDGRVYAFGDARHLGEPGGDSAADLEPTPSGNGYWVLDETGRVYAYGDAENLGSVHPHKLEGSEKPTSLSATRSGNGYWIFTTRGRVLPFGDAAFLGDMSGVRLNGPVLDSVATPSGLGYFMVASDGGIFSFGDARFAGSMGGKPLNKPVQSLVPDGDGDGYWLVASDGGIFAFDAPFGGSMGGKPLNRPVTGMVRFGSGYLMVGEDGGIFNFSDRQFHGSLGADPPAKPVVAVAALP